MGSLGSWTFFLWGKSPPAGFNQPSIPIYARESMEDAVLVYGARGRIRVREMA